MLGRCPEQRRPLRFGQLEYGLGGMAAGLEELVYEHAFEPGIRRFHRWTIVSHRDDPTRQGGKPDADLEFAEV